MKHLAIILFCFALCPLASCSQTFHTIVFTNTNDRTIGPSAQKNTDNVISLTKHIATKMKLEQKLYMFSGDSYNHKSLDSLLKHFEIQKNDIVFFYLNSHGYQSSNGSKFPRITIRNPNIRNRFLVSTDSIRHRLTQRSVGASSIITIIQGCNKTKSSSPDFPPPTLGFEDYSEDNFKTLFYSKKSVMVTSSQPGRTSIATSKGSHFTLSLIAALTQLAPMTTPGAINWDIVLEKAKKNALKLNRRRYPVWDIQNL